MNNIRSAILYIWILCMGNDAIWTLYYYTIFILINLIFNYCDLYILHATKHHLRKKSISQHVSKAVLPHLVPSTIQEHAIRSDCVLSHEAFRLTVKEISSKVTDWVELLCQNQFKNWLSVIIMIAKVEMWNRCGQNASLNPWRYKTFIIWIYFPAIHLRTAYQM